MDLKDVTAALARDDKPENTVYRTSGGLVVKVKTQREHPVVAGQIPFTMTASICDESGAALPGWIFDGLLGKRRVTVPVLSPLFESLEAAAEACRAEYVADMVKIYQTMLAPTPRGMAPAPSPEAFPALPAPAAAPDNDVALMGQALDAAGL